MKIITFLKDWTLIIAILSGIIGYFIYSALPLSHEAHLAAGHFVNIMQPILIFSMLFLTFCKINPHELKLHKWHLWLLLIQGGLFTVIGTTLIILPHSPLRIILEGAMILIICPTATAAAVITKKLGGDMSAITTYTILINLLAALIIPALVPLVHPNPDLDLMNAALLILGKVFPLLLLPLVSALLIRYLFPPLHRRLVKMQELSFYLWAVALSLAIAVTTRSIVHSTVSTETQLWLVAVSAVCCAFQFWAGRKIGGMYGETTTAGQALGQKNTVLAIWVGYTFFSPVTSIAGGFYSIWHNLVNTWQLYRHKKTNQTDTSKKKP